MEELKLSNQQDNEELIKIALSSDEPLDYENKNEVELFVYQMGIKDGTVKVFNYSIYHEYLKWRKDVYGRKTDAGCEGYVSFFRKFAKLFKAYSWSSERFYRLNKQMGQDLKIGERKKLYRRKKNGKK